jgi:dTDP-4-dehydrorhamnose 3,5-epimerase
MRFERLAIPDVVLFEPTTFADERGLFFESFSQRIFDTAIGVGVTFVQDNHSVSQKNVIRGLHYQLTPHAQGKLVRVVRGAVYDVAVDLRRGSTTFGQWVGAQLSAENRRQLWLPEGFAHGFAALEDNTEFLYKTTDFYDRASEHSIRWDDPDIAIDWPVDGEPVVSGKDRNAKSFRETVYF